MAQEPYKDDNKPRLPKLNNRPNSDGEPPRKGPRFSIYWIYAIIFAVLIGFQLFSPFSPNMAKSNNIAFREMIAAGDVQKYVIVDNRKKVEVYIKKDSLKKYDEKIKKLISGKYSEKGPHFYFKYSGDFEKQM